MKCLTTGVILLMLLCVVAVTVVSAGSVYYAYDGAGRLISADFENRTFFDYTYDSAGNLLSKTTGESMAGDVYPDDTLDLADAIVALQTVTGAQPSPVSVRGEINNDHRVGIPEAIFILRELALGN